MMGGILTKAVVVTVIVIIMFGFVIFVGSVLHEIFRGEKKDE